MGRAFLTSFSLQMTLKSDSSNKKGEGPTFELNQELFHHRVRRRLNRHLDDIAIGRVHNPTTIWLALVDLDCAAYGPRTRRTRRLVDHRVLLTHGSSPICIGGARGGRLRILPNSEVVHCQSNSLTRPGLDRPRAIAWANSCFYGNDACQVFVWCVHANRILSVAF